MNILLFTYLVKKLSFPIRGILANKCIYHYNRRGFLKKRGKNATKDENVSTIF